MQVSKTYTKNEPVAGRNMTFLVIGNIPLLYVLNHSWFETLMFSMPGKITLAICCSIVLFSFTRIMQLSKPIEYKA